MIALSVHNNSGVSNTEKAEALEATISVGNKSVCEVTGYRLYRHFLRTIQQKLTSTNNNR